MTVDQIKAHHEAGRTLSRDMVETLLARIKRTEARIRKLESAGHCARCHHSRDAHEDFHGKPRSCGALDHGEQCQGFVSP